VPVNPSGGLLAKGHPIGATGCASWWSWPTSSGPVRRRQVDGASVALAENGGGFLGTDPAAIVITVLSSAKGGPNGVQRGPRHEEKHPVLRSQPARRRREDQIMLEAANRSSRPSRRLHKAIVVMRDELSPEIIEQLKTPTTQVSTDLAPLLHLLSTAT